MLKLTLEHTEGERILTLEAEDLHEMIAKIKDWNDFEGNMEMIRKTKRYDEHPEAVEKEERDSGWYWFGEKVEA